jgi:hypothetical protein
VLWVLTYPVKYVHPSCTHILKKFHIGRTISDNVTNSAKIVLLDGLGQEYITKFVKLSPFICLRILRSLLAEKQKHLNIPDIS